MEAERSQAFPRVGQVQYRRDLIMNCFTMMRGVPVGAKKPIDVYVEHGEPVNQTPMQGVRS
jgi:hypothetical protein